jgi:hypothetical protein
MKPIKFYGVLTLPVFVLLLAACNSPVLPDYDIRDVNYSVTILPSLHGTITPMPGRAIEGTEVHLVVNPDPGYVLKEKTLVFGDLLTGGQTGAKQIISEAPYRFQMPARNVRAEGTFVKKSEIGSGLFTVTIGDIQHGSIVAIPQYGTTGTEVNLTINADPGYALVEGSLKFNKIGNIGSARAPFRFVIPGTDLIITAEFKEQGSVELVESAKTAFKGGSFDYAVDLLEAAYKKDKTNAEAAVYSSLGKLGLILKSPRVRAELKKFGLTSIPGTINGLLNRDTGITTGAWLDIYDGHKLPKFGSPPGFPESFHNYLLETDTINDDGSWTMEHLAIMLFFNTININAGGNPKGINTLLDDLLTDVFGDDFEAAAARTANINYDERFNLTPGLYNALAPLGLDKLMDPEDPVGRAEVDSFFAILRMIKAGIEWLSAYDWEIDTRFARVNLWYTTPDDLSINYCLDKILYDAYGLVGKFWSAKYVDNVLIRAMFPLKNKFFTDRGNGRMPNAKADFVKALDTLGTVLNCYYSGGAQVPQKAMDTLNQDYPWIRNCLTQLRDAISSGGVFYIPETAPSDSSWNISGTDAKYGLNMTKLFTPGQLDPKKLITTEKGGSPKFFGFTEPDVFTTIEKQDDFDKYDFAAVQLNLTPIKEIVVKGISHGNIEWLHNVFPNRSGGPLYSRNAEPFYEWFNELSDLPYIKLAADYQ